MSAKLATQDQLPELDLSLNLLKLSEQFSEDLTEVLQQSGSRPISFPFPDLSGTHFNRLADFFKLGEFERWVLLLAVAIHLQPAKMLRLCAYEIGLDVSQPYHAFLCPYIVQQWFKPPSLESLSPRSRLCAMQLVEFQPTNMVNGTSLMSSIQITPGALAFISGREVLSVEAQQVLLPAAGSAMLGASQVEALRELWAVFESEGTHQDLALRPVVNLYSRAPDAALEVAQTYGHERETSQEGAGPCWQLDFEAFESGVQRHAYTPEALVATLYRDLSYLGGSLIIQFEENIEDITEAEQFTASTPLAKHGWSRRSVTEALCSRLHTPVLLISRDPVFLGAVRDQVSMGRADLGASVQAQAPDIYSVPVLPPTPEEQVVFWGRALNIPDLYMRQPQVLAELQHLTAQFTLGTQSIAQVARDARRHATHNQAQQRLAEQQPRSKSAGAAQKQVKANQKSVEVQQAAALRSAADPQAGKEQALTEVQEQALAEAQPLEFGPFMVEVWEACKRRGRKAFQGIAERIEAKTSNTAAWESLILPPEDLSTLRDIVTQVQHRHQVYQAWGYGAQERGLGITVLFTGTSGGGKTYAAEVMAETLGLDLYRIDLSSVTSKYIGETEKNLKKVFDAADEGGAILLFDEADSVFGKRGDAQSSNDRYANLTTNYLLQRMEAYRGLAILTSNFEGNIDAAFMRRIRFTVRFREPDQGLREQLWLRAFPAGVQVCELDYLRLARFKLTGANIKAVALQASFMASARQVNISTELIEEAIARELRRQGRLISAPG